ncbi:amidase [Zopfia rhizophila CBS 207.26]|uniref:amidase n=1 Tax=Zopfia rhizophila CBS 207.26 TaxID=1314779 RepID=A0A6A6DPC7_9PEZI|nr:amidase [Zopfia rhizophila CBS 207.26]
MAQVGPSVKKRDSVTSQIPDEWRIPALPPPENLPDVTKEYIRQYLTSREVEITESDAVEIVQKTTTGIWKAKELDAHFGRYCTPVGPLHGLPVGLKDTIHVKGVETTMGYVGWVGTFEGDKHREKYKNIEATVAAHLRTLGQRAILYVETSAPQASCSVETANNIIGYTLNPQNRAVTTGGSSGGEGALIAFRGSAAGLGTDIGASIRLPSHFNGLHCLKPSYYRLPLRGIATPMDGQDTAPFVVGPMATTPRATSLLTKSLLSCEPWLSDPLVHEIPWRDDIYDQTLRRANGVGQRLAFGILRSDGVVNPQPPVARALDVVEKAIRRAGHEVIEFSLPNYLKALQLFFKVCFIDGAADFLNQFALSGEPPEPAMLPVFHTTSPKIQDAAEIMHTNKAIRAYCAQFLDHWNGTAKSTATGQPIDAIIMPISPSAAPKKGRVKWLGYASIINLLDYASYALPVLRVDRCVDLYGPGPHTPLGDEDEFVHHDYDPDLYHGAPEKKVLALGESLTDATS